MGRAAPVYIYQNLLYLCTFRNSRFMGLFDKGFKKTNQSFFQKLSRAIVGNSRVDENVIVAI